MTDPLLTAALQLVLDEQVAANSAPHVARAIRRHATAHNACILAIAAEQGRGSTGATVLPDGRVVIVTTIAPLPPD